MRGRDWAKHFISKLLQISHSQWLFRNITLHDTARGVKKLEKKREVLREVARLSTVEAHEIQMESQFLLEIDFGALARSPLERQAYWVSTMQAAWKAGRRNAGARANRGAGARRRARTKKPSRPVWQFEKMEKQLKEELELRRPGRTRGVNVAAFEAQNKSNKRLKRPS